MIELNAIISLCILLLLGLFIYGPWQAVCTDFARQIIFEKRDAIFDMADRGELSFGSCEYHIIRSGLEGLIRFAHELTWPSLVYFWCYIRDDDLIKKPEMLLAIERIPEREVRERARNLVNEALRASAIMTVAKSPGLLFGGAFLVIVVGLVSAIHAGIKQCVTAAFRRSETLILFEAERIGALRDTAEVA